MAAHTLNDDTFESDVISSKGTVLVDFWAEWCGPCKQMSPYIEALADELDGKVTVAKLNVDENPMTTSKYGVRGLPTLMLFKDGEVAASHLGAMSKQKITEWLKKEGA